MQKTILFTISAVATAVIPAARFVGMMTGAPCAAAAKALGVSQSDAAVGEALAVDVLGTSIVESGGAFAAGTALKADATGRAVDQAGVGVIVAYAVTPATAAGQKVEVLLTGP